jgi:hypothetical protein
MTDLAPNVGLPPGVHPHDRSVGIPDHGAVVPQDGPTSHVTGRRAKPWGTEPEESLGVFQRLSTDWATGLIVLSTTNSPLRAVRQQKGRTFLALWVPATVPIAGSMQTTPNGVMFGVSEGAVAQPGTGSPINVGDSVPIYSEDSAWVALQPGATSGYVCYLHCWSPPGGGLDI